MKSRKRPFPSVLTAAGAVLLIAVFSLVPALGLWAGERAALGQPHERTAQAGAMSLTCDDIYIARMLKKLALARASTDSGYQSASTYPSSMTYAERGSVRANDAAKLIETVHEADLLPDAWYDSVRNAINGSWYFSTDSIGFMNCIAWSERDEGMYVIGLTVETQSGTLIGFWVSAGESEDLPAPDTAAVLSAYTRYLGAEQANDWAVPVDTDFAANSIYSANAELLLTVQTGSYTAYPHYEFTQDSTPRARTYFCLNAQHMKNEKIQHCQAYTRSFSGVPDMPAGGGQMRSVQWAINGWGRSPAVTLPDCCYELATSGVWIDAASGESGRKQLILKTDYAARRQSPLCSVEGCPHEDASCPAYVSETDGDALTSIGGKLYLLRGANSILSVSDAGRARLTEIDPATGARRLLCQFPLHCEVYSDRLPCTDGAALYGMVYDAQNMGFVGVRIDLATGEYTNFPLSGGTASDPAILGPAETGMLIGFARIAFDSTLCPPAADSETGAVTNTLYARANVQCIYYNTATGLRQEVPLSEDLIKGDYISTATLEDGKLYCTERSRQKDDRVADYRVWQFNLFTGEKRLMYTYPNAGPDINLFVTGILQPMTEGQEKYLKVCTDNGGGKDMSVYLLNTEREETLQFPQDRWSVYWPYTGPLAQTNEPGAFLTASDPLENTWDDGRQSYDLLSASGERAAIEMWLPEPALG